MFEMTTHTRIYRTLALGLLLTSPTLTGCGAADSAGAKLGGGEGAGVGQGGAQDFGQFRQILLDGDIPGPDTIDDVGFFNEHKIDFPAADCGEDVCVHGLLGVMGNMITGSNCTTLMLGMNTPIDPDELERPPLNLALAIDVSGSMQGANISAVRSGLTQMLPELQPEDRVSLVAFSTDASVSVEFAAPDDPALGLAVAQLDASGGTNIYDGLREAYELVAAHEEEGRQNRVILLSDGVATEGLTSEAHILSLAEAYGGQGLGLTTIGMGEDFDVSLMQGLSERGAGSFYFLEDPQAVEEVFVEEVNSFVVPLARKVEIDLDVFAGYDLRRGYGTKQVEIVGNSAFIEIPTVQLAHRESVSDNTEGRRGGGGAMLVELTPTGDSPLEVGDINFVYETADGSSMVDQQVEIRSPLAAWETPDNGYFEQESVEKGFVMLNLFVGFQMAAERAAAGDDPAALAVLGALEENVTAWEQVHPDSDIEDDLIYVRLFIENIEARASSTNTPIPVEPWPTGD
jgi:Ca-activated chloride channel family protein